jgi:hypothetical protein
MDERRRHRTIASISNSKSRRRKNDGMVPEKGRISPSKIPVRGFQHHRHHYYEDPTACVERNAGFFEDRVECKHYATKEE